MDDTSLQLADWRRQIGELYAAVRAADDPRQGHAIWRAGRDALFRDHPQSPLLADDPMRSTGVPYWPYDPGLRFEVPLLPADGPAELSLPTDDTVTQLRRIGRVDLPAPVNASVDVWWLIQYGGGLFLPLRDGTAATTGGASSDGSATRNDGSASGDRSYGGGRYVLDTAKGADLGVQDGALVVDLNFLFHPSCRYNPDWVCPLAPAGNRVTAPVRAGERLAAGG